MRQKVEIEVDVPDGWEPTGEYRLPKIDEPHLTASGMGLILRKIEPKRESRWANLYQHTFGMSCRSRDECTDILSGERVSLIRIDYEDGKPVAVTLEPEGEGA